MPRTIDTESGILVLNGSGKDCFASDYGGPRYVGGAAEPRRSGPNPFTRPMAPAPVKPVRDRIYSADHAPPNGFFAGLDALDAATAGNGRCDLHRLSRTIRKARSLSATTSRG